MILAGELRAGETVKVEAADPQTVTRQHFEGVLERSPFTRSLNRSGRLVLTGVALVNGSPTATLIDVEEGRLMVISDSPNEQGWELVEIKSMDDLESAVAIIAVESGVTVRAYHDEDLMKIAKQRLRARGESRAQEIAAQEARGSLPKWLDLIEDPEERGQAIAKWIEGGKFDKAPFEAVELAIAQSDPRTRGPVLSAAFGRLGGGVGGVEYKAAVNRLNSLPRGRDRDFAINGLAHGLVGRDPKTALKWANSISNEGFRKVVVKNVTRRIERR